MSDIADFSASQLLSLYRDRQLSPVAATKAALERINTYNNSVNAFAIVDENTALAEAQASDKEYLRDELRTDVGKPLSKSSINAGIAALKSFFKWMCYTYPEIIATNPTLGIKLEKVPLPPAQSLTPEQMERVWSALELLGETKQRDTALVHILSHGLRAGEVVQLNVGSFDGKLLFLADTKTNEPRLVTLENVPRYQNSQSFSIVLSALEQEGYSVNYSVVNMADFGLPQARRRLVLVASRGCRVAIPAYRKPIGWYDTIAHLIPTMSDSQLLPKQRQALEKFLTGNAPIPLLIERVGAIRFG